MYSAITSKLIQNQLLFHFLLFQAQNLSKNTTSVTLFKIW